jgi:DNA-binding IclR family transcriptional regulator
LIADLRIQEQQLLSALVKLGGSATVEQLMEKTMLQDAAIMRNALTLQERGFIAIFAKVQNVIKLTLR